MTKITVSEDCGNAPRKEFILDFNVAFAENDLEKILNFMSDDITWDMIGNKKIQGKKEARKFLETMGSEKATELIIKTVITHGDTASANGEIIFPSISVAFCDVYKFNGHKSDAKIQALTSYGIELKK